MDRGQIIEMYTIKVEGWGCKHLYKEVAMRIYFQKLLFKKGCVRLKKLFSLLTLLLLLVSCSKSESNHYKYIFLGESEHWKARYTVEGKEVWEEGGTTYSHNESYEFLIEYKGTLDKLATFDELEYSFETTAGGGGGTRTLDNLLQDLHFTHRGSSNGAKVSKDETIEVTVKWGNNKEKIKLVNRNKS
ncbi:hypothetical protein [Halobacillus naozhouensis]|uniref:DUF4944 domain-containing protein n=1 Tax=Halobacillus naozhouensis TaxID=554880 RepID=A0ABY8J200_9BACI|nr:hypothetical protein [Halobacillus naozhouensis]WFT76529.1 hypothetical protein P9989_09265 [Halobacillus naozhouensis]